MEQNSENWDQCCEKKMDHCVWSFGPYLECKSCEKTIFLKSNGLPLSA